MPKKNRLSLSDIEEMRELRASGRLLKELAKRFEVTIATVAYHVKDQEYRDKINSARVDRKRKTGK